MSDHKKLTSIHRQSLGDRKYQSNNIAVFKTPTVPIRKGKRKIRSRLEFNHHTYNSRDCSRDNKPVNCTIVKSHHKSIVISTTTNKHKSTTSTKSVNKRKVYERTSYHSNTSRHLVVTPASTMIYNLTKRAREVYEDVMINDHKRRKLDAGTFKVEDDFSLKEPFSLAVTYTKRQYSTIDMSDQNENLLSTANGLCEYQHEICSNIEPTLIDIKTKIEPVTTIDDNSIINDYKPVNLPERCTEEIVIKTECSTKIEGDTMDMQNVKPSGEVSTEVESDDIKSDPALQPPLTIYIGQLLWVRYQKFCFWPAIVYQYDAETKDGVDVRFFANKGQIGSVGKDNTFEFRGINSYLQYKKGMESKLKKSVWKSWFSMKSPNWTNALIEGTFLLSKDVDIRLPLFDVIVICSLYDTKKKATGWAKLISDIASNDQLNTVQNMFAENPNIFEEVKQELDEMSSAVDIPAQETAKRSRPRAPSVPASTKRSTVEDEITEKQRRNSTSSKVSNRRQSLRLATNKEQRQLSMSQPAIDIAGLKIDMQQQEKQPKRSQLRKTDEEKQIEFEKDLEEYMNISRQKGILFKGLRRGNVCKKCLIVRKVDLDLVKCAGDCGNYVHRNCSVAVCTNVSNEVRCDECIDASSQICYACRKPCSESMERCSVKSCGRYYHNKCLTKWLQTKDQESDKMKCPLHVCHTCVQGDPKNTYFPTQDGQLTQCIMCPTSYHIDSNCIPAGVRILTTNQHICVRHRSNGNRKLVSLNWCYICGEKGGKYTLCDICPLTVHTSCLKDPPPEDEPHSCDSCENGGHPLYGDVVWAKYAHYRWWPSVIVPPACIPSTMTRKNEDYFCIRFFGTWNFGWIGRNCVYQYNEDDKIEVGSGTFIQAVEQAHKWYETLTTNPRMSEKELKPLPYTKLQKLIAFPPAKKPKENSSDFEPCNCSADDPDPCGPTSNCANRRLYWECDANLCPAGVKCKNQDIGKQNYAPIKRQHFGDKGFGLVADGYICEENLIIEYVGELVTEEEYQYRFRTKQTQNLYFMKYDNGLYIDAEKKGNEARFMNHSCNPNCETRVILVKGVRRIGLFAIRNIEKGVELTFNYQFDDGRHTCYCGESNCSGVIGGKVGGRCTP